MVGWNDKTKISNQKGKLPSTRVCMCVVVTHAKQSDEVETLVNIMLRYIRPAGITVMHQNGNIKKDKRKKWLEIVTAMFTGEYTTFMD